MSYKLKNTLFLLPLLTLTLLITPSLTEAKPYRNTTKNQNLQNSTTQKVLVKGSRVPYGIWVDESKWQQSQTQNNEDTEYEFKRIREDLFAMIIAERIEIPRETLKDVIVENIKFVGTDVNVVAEEVRKVNDVEVLSLQIEAKIAGIHFVYYSYNYCGNEGTIQMITCTSKNLLDEYKGDMEDFLNGFTIIK